MSLKTNPVPDRERFGELPKKGGSGAVVSFHNFFQHFMLAHCAERRYMWRHQVRHLPQAADAQKGRLWSHR